MEHFNPYWEPRRYGPLWPRKIVSNQAPNYRKA